MKITKEWINQYTTKNGGWTAAQLECLGVQWPPVKGWLRTLIGKEVEEEQALKFERFGLARRPVGGQETFAAAIHRLWEERKKCVHRTKRLPFLIRWAAVKVAHKKAYIKRRRNTTKSWKRFMKQQCWVCEVKATCRHHIIQVQHGGGNDERNIVPLCDGCHAAVHPWMDATAHPIVEEAREMDSFRF